MTSRPRPRQRSRLAALREVGSRDKSLLGPGTPYRLPRLNEETESGPQGLNEDNFRIEVTKAIRPQRFEGPNFQQALIAPNTSPRFFAADPSDPIYRNFARARTTAFVGCGRHGPGPEIDPSPTPVFLRSRTPLGYAPGGFSYPSGSNYRHGTETTTALEWTLSPHKNVNFDRKGKQKNQGPFSREFTVHVSAPNNWMKMKWGRQIPRRFLPPLG